MVRAARARSKGPFLRGSGEGRRRASSDRPGGDRGRRTRRCAGSSNPRHSPRPSCNACHAGRCFGSNAAASWGFHYHDLIEEPKPREVITIFELDTSGEPFARRSTTTSGHRRPIRTASCIQRSIIPACAVDHATWCAGGRTSCRTSRCRRACISAPWGWRRPESDFVSSIPPELYRRQYRRLARSAREPDVLSGRCAGRVLLGGRSACGPGRQRAWRHRHRDLANRRFRVHPA